MAGQGMGDADGQLRQAHDLLGSAQLSSQVQREQQPVMGQQGPAWTSAPRLDQYLGSPQERQQNMSQIVASLHEGLSPQNGHHLGAPQHLAPQPASSTATQDPANPALAEHLLDAESFALVVHPDGEVRSCASGGLRDPALYPHFAAACKYLVGAVQLDAAALALRRRCEDPSVALAIDSKPPMGAGRGFGPGAFGGPGIGSVSLLASASAKSQAYSKLVRKACRAVFKRVIRQMLLREGGQQLPLCNSNHCIVLRNQEMDPNLASWVHGDGGAMQQLLPMGHPAANMAAFPPGPSAPVDPSGGGQQLLQPPGAAGAAPQSAGGLPQQQQGTQQQPGVMLGWAGAGQQQAAPGEQQQPPVPSGGQPSMPVGHLRAPGQAMGPGPVLPGQVVGPPRCAAGGTCAPTRAALGWPDHLPCVDPSKVSVPVDKAIGLIQWVQSLGHDVPELLELDEIKRRSASDAEQRRNTKAKLASAGKQGDRGGDAAGDDRDAIAGLAALRSAAGT